MEDRAKFIGYQECPGRAPLALYNVLDKKHRLYGSTVSARTLAKENIPVPATPKYKLHDVIQFNRYLQFHPDEPILTIGKIDSAEINETGEGLYGISYQNKNDKTIHTWSLESNIIGLATKQNPGTTERDQIVAAYDRQGIETLAGKGGFWKREKATEKSLGFITLAKARKETGVDLHKTRGPALVQSSWGDYAIIEMLNRPKTNPANKSYKGVTDVKAIGNIPAPRPGMMMVVNPSGPQRWSMKKMEQHLAEKNATDGTNFSLVGAYGQYELWSGGDRIDAGSLQDIYQAWIKVRYNEKYQAKKNPALLVLNPRQAVKAYAVKGGYTVIIGQLVYEMSANATSPQGVNQYAGELKDLPGAKQGRLVAVKSLPLAVQQAIQARMGKENPSKLQRWHDKLDRHYQTMVRLAKHVGLKEINGKKLSTALLKLENQAHKATTDYANGDIDEAQMDKIDSEVTGKVFKLFGKLPGFFVNRDPRGYALKIDDKFMPRYEKVGLECDMGGYGILSPEISKDNPAAKTAKKNPNMVKDLTTYRQKQQLKDDIKRMAQQPQRRQHPEFATLELAAEYVEKAHGQVTGIIQGQSSYIIRHANGIAAFSTGKNNKLIML